MATDREMLDARQPALYRLVPMRRGVFASFGWKRLSWMVAAGSVILLISALFLTPPHRPLFKPSDTVKERRGKLSPEFEKLDVELAHALLSKRGQPIFPPHSPRPQLARQSDGKIRVLVQGDLDDALLERIRQMGGEVVHRSDNELDVWLSLTGIETLADWVEVRSIKRYQRIKENWRSGGG